MRNRSLPHRELNLPVPDQPDARCCVPATWSSCVFEALPRSGAACGGQRLSQQRPRRRTHRRRGGALPTQPLHRRGASACSRHVQACSCAAEVGLGAVRAGDPAALPLDHSSGHSSSCPTLLAHATLGDAEVLSGVVEAAKHVRQDDHGVGRDARLSPGGSTAVLDRLSQLDGGPRELPHLRVV